MFGARACTLNTTVGNEHFLHCAVPQIANAIFVVCVFSEIRRPLKYKNKHIHRPKRYAVDTENSRRTGLDFSARRRRFCRTSSFVHYSPWLTLVKRFRPYFPNSSGTTNAITISRGFTPFFRRLVYGSRVRSRGSPERNK